MDHQLPAAGSPGLLDHPAWSLGSLITLVPDQSIDLGPTSPDPMGLSINRGLKPRQDAKASASQADHRGSRC